MLSRSLPLVFDRQTISLFANRLSKPPTYKFKYKSDAKDAAVLLPLCIVNQKPSVLFTVRNLNMRTHRGEIRYCIYTPTEKKYGYFYLFVCFILTI